MYNKITKIFEAGDGRIAAEHVIHLRDGIQARLFTDGWDCVADDEVIDVWHIPYVPANDCEDAIAVPYLERCRIDCCTTLDIPKAKLTKNRTFDIISDVGAFILRRKCGAEAVNVYIQYMKQ